MSSWQSACAILCYTVKGKLWLLQEHLVILTSLSKILAAGWVVNVPVLLSGLRRLIQPDHSHVIMFHQKVIPSSLGTFQSSGWRYCVVWFVGLILEAILPRVCNVRVYVGSFSCLQPASCSPCPSLKFDCICLSNKRYCPSLQMFPYLCPGHPVCISVITTLLNGLPEILQAFSNSFQLLLSCFIDSCFLLLTYLKWDWNM